MDKNWDTYCPNWDIRFKIGTSDPKFGSEIRHLRNFKDKIVFKTRYSRFFFSPAALMRKSIYSQISLKCQKHVSDFFRNWDIRDFKMPKLGHQRFWSVPIGTCPNWDMKLGHRGKP